MFDTAEIAVDDRVEAWREITGRALVRNEFSVDRATPFQATLRAARLGPVDVTGLSYSTMRSWRSTRMIRQADPELYSVALILRRPQGILLGRREHTVREHELVAYSTFHPFATVVDVPSGTAASVVIQFPRGLVPFSVERVNPLMGVPLPGDSGVGGLLAAFLRRLAVDGDRLGGPADAVRVGHVLTDLVTAWFAHHIDTEGQVAPESRQHVRFLQVREFIRQHLPDPDLTPSTVAAAHHISLRTLHRLFHQQGGGTTVAAHIRAQRLAMIRRDLADPVRAGLPIHTVAAGWGYPHPADFTRVFRAAFDITPSEYRRLALSRGRDGTDCEVPGARGSSPRGGARARSGRARG